MMSNRTRLEMDAKFMQRWRNFEAEHPRTVLSGVGGSVNRRMKDYDLIPVGGSVTTFALMPE
jgi:hypothetical protein